MATALSPPQFEQSLHCENTFCIDVKPEQSFTDKTFLKLENRYMSLHSLLVLFSLLHLLSVSLYSFTRTFRAVLHVTNTALQYR